MPAGANPGRPWRKACAAAAACSLELLMGRQTGRHKRLTIMYRHRHNWLVKAFATKPIHDSMAQFAIADTGARTAWSTRLLSSLAAAFSFAVLVLAVVHTTRHPLCRALGGTRAGGQEEADTAGGVSLFSQIDADLAPFSGAATNERPRRGASCTSAGEKPQTTRGSACLLQTASRWRWWSRRTVVPQTTAFGSRWAHLLVFVFAVCATRAWSRHATGCKRADVCCRVPSRLGAPPPRPPPIAARRRTTTCSARRGCCSASGKVPSCFPLAE